MATGSVWFHRLLRSRDGPRLQTQTTPPFWREPSWGCDRRLGSSLQLEEPALRDAGRGGSSYPMPGVVAGIPRPGRRYPAFVMYPRETCMVSVLFSLLRLLCLKLSGSLRPAGMILNTLVIFDAWLFARSSKHRLWFQGWGCPKSLFQNQLVTSAPLIYALQTSEAIFKTGFYQCMQGGATPLLFLPRSNSMDSFHTYLPV